MFVSRSMTQKVVTIDKDTGKAIILTSVILMCGFSVSMMGSVTPIITFGALTTFSISMALVGDLFILPVLLIFYEGFLDKIKGRPTIGGKNITTTVFHGEHHELKVHQSKFTSKDKKIG